MTMGAAERISLALATGALALGYASSRAWIGSALVIACGLAWWIGRRWSRTRIASSGLIVFTAAAAIGMWIGATAGWMLTGTTAALAAWDMAHYLQRAKLVSRVEQRDELARAHLRRLLIVAGTSLASGWLGLSLQVDLSFGPALLLGLIALLALSAMIGFQRRESESS